VHTVGMKTDGQTGQSAIVVIELDRILLVYKREPPLGNANY
jgi:hypothetical protein